LWPNRIIEHLFAAITLTERTGKGSQRAMANGVVLGTKLKTRASPAATIHCPAQCRRIHDRYRQII
jgi:hypothetical protein